MIPNRTGADVNVPNGTDIDVQISDVFCGPPC